jgi:hypothetical protein
MFFADKNKVYTIPLSQICIWYNIFKKMVKII